MMPTQSWKNLDPTAGVHWEEPEEWWELIRDNWLAYDRDIAPTNTMAAVCNNYIFEKERRNFQVLQEIKI